MMFSSSHVLLGRRPTFRQRCRPSLGHSRSKHFASWGFLDIRTVRLENHRKQISSNEPEIETLSRARRSLRPRRNRAGDGSRSRTCSLEQRLFTAISLRPSAMCPHGKHRTPDQPTDARAQCRRGRPRNPSSKQCASRLDSRRPTPRGSRHSVVDHARIHLARGRVLFGFETTPTIGLKATTSAIADAAALLSRIDAVLPDHTRQAKVLTVDGMSAKFAPGAFSAPERQPIHGEVKAGQRGARN